jgi:hypothetical protein
VVAVDDDADAFVLVIGQVRHRAPPRRRTMHCSSIVQLFVSPDASSVAIVFS